MNEIINRLFRAVAKRAPVHAQASRLTRPIASFTFDDFPQSALETGGRILEARGVRGSYYACGELAGSNYRDVPHYSPEHLQDAVRRGHEIGCHAFEHLHFSKAGVRALRDSVKRNAEFLHKHLQDFRPVSFAYPFGDADWATKTFIAQQFPIARGVWFGTNTGRMDFSQLRATPLDMRWRHHVDIPREIHNAKAGCGWLIFFTHDVQDSPTSEGCSPDHLSRIVDNVLENGFEILPVKAAAARVRFGDGEAQ
jgi:peptidoglycan/xylan/chitin deacetylase (PgdA/CDA1 family)